MKKSLFALALIAIAVAMSGCATIHYADGSTQRYVMLQVGVIVRVVNNCAPLMDLERVGGVVVKGLPYGESATVPLISRPFSGSNRGMPLTAKGYTAAKEYLGSASREFNANIYEGSREEVWEVDQLRLPNGRGGCQ